MAIPRFQLYSSSPDGLAQLQRGYESMYLGADQSNREAASRAAEINLRNFLQARAQDEAARIADMERREQLRRERMSVALKDRSFTEDRRQFDVGTGLRRDQLAIEKLRVGSGGTKEKDRLAAIEAKNQEDFAIAEAEEGMVTDEAQLLAKYPSISKEAAKFAAARSKGIRSQADQEFKLLEDAAAQLNEAQRLKQSVTSATREVKSATPDFGRLFSAPLRFPLSNLRNIGTEAAKAFDSGGARSSARNLLGSSMSRLYGENYERGNAETIDPRSIARIEERILANPELIKQLIVDPATGQYKAPPRPSWLQPKADTMTKLMREAEDAIRAGADPVKVRERLARMTATN